MSGSCWGLSESLRGKRIDTQQGLVPGLIPQMLRWLALVGRNNPLCSPLNDGALWSSSSINLSYWAMDGHIPSSSIDRGADVGRTRKMSKIFTSAGNRVSIPTIVSSEYSA